GLGGTNVHLVLEEGPQREATGKSRPWQVLPISARSQGALRAARERLAAYLREEPEVELADVAYTLQVGRAGFAHRSVVVCRGREEAIKGLEQGEGGGRESALVERRDRPVAFLFADEGEFSRESIQALYTQEASFRQEIDHCCDLLKASQGLDLRAFLLSQSDQASSPEVFTLLALFVTQYALARTLMHWGIQPSACYGSGRAEYRVACLTGVLSLEDALTLVVAQAHQKSVEIQHSSLHTPQIAYISALTGTWATSEQVTDPHYWAQNRSSNTSLSAQAHVLLRETGPILLCIGSPDRDAAWDEKDTLPLVLESGGGQSGLKTLLSALSGLWLNGVTIDWSAFSAGEQRQRIGLPTYPFERQRYWVDSPEEKLLKQRRPEASAGKKLGLDDWFYESIWQRRPLEVETPAKPEHRPSSPLLLFMDESGLSVHLADGLIAVGGTVIRVSPGAHYRCVDPHNYIIRPAERGDYDILCQSLLATKCFPQSIIHTWGVDRAFDMPTSLDGAHFAHAQERGFYSLLWLAQSLGKHLVEEAIHLYVVASQVLSLTTGADLAPEKATILGICKVIPQEYLNIICRIIDVDQVQHPALIAHLLSELNDTSSETVVAYRNSERWVQRQHRISLVPENALPSRLRPNSTYLITGGLGNIGMMLAEYLARTIQARLVLVGRSTLPARISWENWLEQHQATDEVSQRIQRLLALEAQGARVLIVQADVADSLQLEAAFVQGEQQFGLIHGVIHAAGMTSEEAFKTISYLERADCELHFQPKIHGLLALEQVTRGRSSIDFCLLFSSLSTVLGGLSLAAYTAANAFMEAFVQQRSQEATIDWISVAWDTWQFKQERHSSPGATVTPYSMSAQEGIAALERVLASQGISHLVHSTGDLSARIRQWVLLEGLRQESAPSSVTASGAERSRVPRQRSEVEQALQHIWQEVLGLTDVGLYDNYFDLGGNSLNGLQVMARVRKVFQVQMPVVTLFEAPTISALVELLVPTAPPSQAQDASRTEQLRTRRSLARRETRTGDIALVAMTGRFPGATSVEQFWQNLQAGQESITFFSEEELLAAGVSAELVQQPNYVRARPILPEEVVSGFDAAFFGYSPREAQL
ncbi:MAG: SDR family oxidoreductase, partial [Ktedonobacteraceae bacterium]